MSLIESPYRWVEQPPEIPVLDWNNPITQGLKFCAVPVGNTLYDLVTQTFPTTANGTFRNVAFPRNGGKSKVEIVQAVQCTSTTSSEMLWGASDTLRGGDIYSTGTLLALAGFRPPQTDGNVAWIGGNTEVVSSGNQPVLGIDSFTSVGRGNIQVAKWNNKVHASPTAFLGNPFVDQLHFFGYAFGTEGTVGDYFGDRQSESWTGKPAWTNSAPTSRRARIFTGGAAVNLKGAVIALFLMWNRRLTAAEYISLYDDVWQIFVPPEQELFFTHAGGTGVTINCTPAEAAADGVQATISSGVTISCTPANATAEGVQASIIETVSCTPANADADGVQASIIETVSCTPANADADGVQATIISGDIINCTPANADADGVQATILAGVVISCTPAGADADGVQATIASGVTISCTPANADADGVQATIQSGNVISCTPANADADGVQATISSAITILCTPASADADGVVATVASPITVSCSPALADADGVSATIIAGILIVCTPANATAAGVTATISGELPPSFIDFYDDGYEPLPMALLTSDPALQILTLYLEKELNEIAKEFKLLREGRGLRPRHTTPTKPRDGQLAVADGTDWDPGSGAGLYLYQSGSWNKL